MRLRNTSRTSHRAIPQKHAMADAHAFHNIYYAKGKPRKPWTGRARWRDRSYDTALYTSPAEAARAVDRYSQCSLTTVQCKGKDGTGRAVWSARIVQVFVEAGPAHELSCQPRTRCRAERADH